MERAIQIYAIIHLTVIGVSHIVQPHAWVDFFVWLRARGHAGVFAVAFISLWFGSLIVAFHNVWEGLPVALTVLGWAQVLKAALYFCRPEFGLEKLAIPSHERARLFVVPGALFVALALLLTYHLTTTP